MVSSFSMGGKTAKMVMGCCMLRARQKNPFCLPLCAIQGQEHHSMDTANKRKLGGCDPEGEPISSQMIYGGPLFRFRGSGGRAASRRPWSAR
jgi:hypothetical protein